MSKRALIVVAMIAAGVILLVLGIRGVLDGPAEPIDGARSTASPAQAPTPPFDPPEEIDEIARDAHRTAAAPPGFAAPLKRATAPTPSDVADATLIVRCVAKSSGKPIAGVRVYVTTWGRKHGSIPWTSATTPQGELRAAPITAENGEVELAGPSGLDLELSVFAVNERASPAWQEVPALVSHEQRTLILELTVGEDVHYHGILLARDDRTPVANGRVRAMRSEGQTTSFSGDRQEKNVELARAVSDSDGRFELSTFSWKNLHLQVDAQGFGPVLLALANDCETWETAHVTLLERAATIEATILDARGTPLAEARVVAATDSHRLLAESRWSDTSSPPILTLKWEGKTANSGRCTLENLPARVPLSVSVLAPQIYSTRPDEILKEGGTPLVLTPGEVRTIEWQIGVNCRLNGTLVDEQAAPVPYHAVWLTPAMADRERYFVGKESSQIEARATTNGDGRFSFADIPAGMWWIGPAADAVELPGTSPLAPLARVIKIPPGTREMTVDLAAQRGLYIRGQVLDADGVITRTAYVSGTAESSHWPQSAHMNDDGSFVLGPLMRGRYRLSALSFAQNGSSETVIANAGDEHVILKLRRNGTIHGRVVDAKTGEGCRANVVCSTRDAEQPDFKGINTGDDGSFEIDGLEPGSFDLTARLPDGRVGRARDVLVYTGARVDGLVLRAEPAATLHVRCERSTVDNWIQVWCDGALVGMDGGMHKGSVSNQTVPKGHITIVMGRRIDAKTDSRAVEVGAGEEREVVFADEP